MRFSVLLLLFVLLISSCGGKTQADEEDQSSLPEDFISFYNRFLSDSIYQVEHINFPLEGIPDNVSNRPDYDGQFRWQQDQWKMHKPIDKEASGFDVIFTRFGPIIIEEITHKSGQYGMLRRYSNNGEEWRLIYYAGLNPIRK